MDNGHTENDNFEQSFMNSVDQAVGGGMPPVEPMQPMQQMQQPIQPAQPMQSMQQPMQTMQPIAGVDDDDSKKKFPPIFVITTVVCALIIVVLLVVLFIMGSKPNIASDSSENVRVNDAGTVEAIGVYCKMDKGTIYLNKNNRYFVETDNLEETLVMVEEGVYQQVDPMLERGTYTVDGYDIHFIADDDDDYYAKYSHHELELKNKTYKCENYD